MMNKVNYQKELDRLIEQMERQGGEEPPRLFLHSCCAPCSSYVLEYLSSYFSICVFYYNPNIAPAEEYKMRVDELKRLVQEMPVKYPVTFREGDYCPEEFYRKVKGLEKEPEGGARCEVCFRMRLEEAARLAFEGGYEYFTTTLSISPLKNAALLADISMEMGEKYGVKWLPSDFKKKEGYKRSIELSATYQLYRQNYCGCVFSKRASREQRTNQD